MIAPSSKCDMCCLFPERVKDVLVVWGQVAVACVCVCVYARNMRKGETRPLVWLNCRVQKVAQSAGYVTPPDMTVVRRNEPAMNALKHQRVSALSVRSRRVPAGLHSYNNEEKGHYPDEGAVDVPKHVEL
uniref:Uncharacterized protein n=1 Tax=Timema bartmani TaxID=61472 RepID=A0A7R9I6T3_9NEOP|nr:unnamed protein product [Timema bartmani]